MEPNGFEKVSRPKEKNYPTFKELTDQVYENV
jgi:hypothetical protein